jgi:hypothetical protein
LAHSQAVCVSFKQDLLNGYHAFGTTVVRATSNPDVFMAALYLATATLGSGTTAYSSTGEVSGTNYTAGGTTVSNATPPATSGTTAYWTPSANFTWTNVTLSTAFNALLLYNATQAGNHAVAVYVFGSQTVTAGNFTLTQPTNAAGTALLQLN